MDTDKSRLIAIAKRVSYHENSADLPIDNPPKFPYKYERGFSKVETSENSIYPPVHLLMLSQYI